MNKAELLNWYYSIEEDKMPQYIEASDANWRQVFYDGEWQNAIYSWSVFCNEGIWMYAETDSDRGYVFDLKKFEKEEDAVEYAKSILILKYKAIGGNTKEEMLIRYIQKDFGYSEKLAKSWIEKMKAYKDIIDEFYNYSICGRFYKKDGTKTEVCGYTAENLNKKYNLSPLGAYNYLVYLKEDPAHALADLKAGLPRK